MDHTPVARKTRATTLPSKREREKGEYFQIIQHRLSFDKRDGVFINSIASERQQKQTATIMNEKFN